MSTTIRYLADFADPRIATGFAARPVPMGAVLSDGKASALHMSSADTEQLAAAFDQFAGPALENREAA